MNVKFIFLSGVSPSTSRNLKHRDLTRECQREFFETNNLHKEKQLKTIITSLTLSLLLALNFATADTIDSCPDGHAPIGVMGDHGHKTGEWMLSYRSMVMNMQGLQTGMDAVETADLLRDFKQVPTRMDMKMHMIGAMFAPHDRITFMAMINHQQHYMEMEGGSHPSHGKSHASHMSTHEMSSAGLGDVKGESLLSLWRTHHLNLIGNIGVSFPTGSITQTGMPGNLLPYPMQLGSGSFEAMPGITLFGFYGNWFYGSQLRGVFPLHRNGSNYRHGNVVTATAWGARWVSDWLNLGGRLLFLQRGGITGNHPDLDPRMSPSHHPDFRGGTWLDLAVSSNLIVPSGKPLAGQRLAIEFQMPIYQNLTGTQLKNRWRLTLGLQCAFRL